MVLELSNDYRESVATRRIAPTVAFCGVPPMNGSRHPWVGLAWSDGSGDTQGESLLRERSFKVVKKRREVDGSGLRTKEEMI
jgi:hypothetical protein